MSGEIVLVEGTPVTHVAAGAAVSSGSVSAAPDAVYSVATNGGGYPDADVVLTTSFGAAPSVQASILLLVRQMNADGTNDEPQPSASFPYKQAGRFVISADTTQTLTLRVRDLPPQCEFYLFNTTSVGQAMSAGWTLKINPITYKPAP